MIMHSPYSSYRSQPRLDKALLADDETGNCHFMGTLLALPSKVQLDLLVEMRPPLPMEKITEFCDFFEPLSNPALVNRFPFDPLNLKMIENLQQMAEKFDVYRIIGIRDCYVVFEQQLVLLSFRDLKAKAAEGMCPQTTTRKLEENAEYSGIRLLVIGGKVVFSRPIEPNVELSSGNGKRANGRRFKVAGEKSANQWPIYSSQATDIVERMPNGIDGQTFFGDFFRMEEESDFSSQECAGFGVYPDIDLELFRHDLDEYLNTVIPSAIEEIDWTVDTFLNFRAMCDRRIKRVPYKFDAMLGTSMAIQLCRSRIENLCAADIMKFGWKRRIGAIENTVYATRISSPALAEVNDADFGSDFEPFGGEDDEFGGEDVFEGMDFNPDGRDKAVQPQSLSQGLLQALPKSSMKDFFKMRITGED